MLYGYFDESGEHDQATGALVRLVVGGCMASYESWQVLTDGWNKVRSDAGFAMFHMADFESRKAKPFDEWTESKRRDTLNALLDLMAKHIEIYAAFSCHVDAGGKFRKAYQNNLNGILGQLFEFDDETKIVVARHKSYDLSHLQCYWEGTEFGRKMVHISSDDPEDVPPLQAADIYAYEIMRSLRKDGKRRARYPLWRLRGNGEVTFTFHR